MEGGIEVALQTRSIAAASIAPRPPQALRRRWHLYHYIAAGIAWAVPVLILAVIAARVNVAPHLATDLVDEHEPLPTPPSPPLSAAMWNSALTVFDGLEPLGASGSGRFFRVWYNQSSQTVAFQVPNGSVAIPSSGMPLHVPQTQV